VYVHLATFINVGEGGAEIVRDIIRGIARFKINKPLTLSYVSDEDGRVKNVEVIEGSSYNGVEWEYEMTFADAESISEADGGMGLQIFWNRYPRKGIAILKPYNIDRDESGDFADAIFLIDYSEAGENGYDAHMIVEITGLPVLDPLENPYTMSTLKMFVGKTGDIVEVYGNSNHPNAKFFNSDSGFNWAFVAVGDERQDIGVAEVGLPFSELDESSREVLLGDYSIKNVFTQQIYEVWPNISPESVETFLLNSEAPGFFNRYGFVQGGTSPGSQYNSIMEIIPSLSPYNPKDIADLTISFKMN
jgi:hypothetical protein